MKTKIPLIALILVTISCNEPETGRVDSVTETADTGSVRNRFSVPEVELSYFQKHFREIRGEEYIGTRTLNEHLADPNIPALFKEIFQVKKELNDGDKNISVTDSLFSQDEIRHPFYFVLATRCLWYADGAFAEPFYMGISSWIRQHPAAFLRYFRQEKVLTDADLRNWADGVAMGIAIDHEGTEQAGATELKTDMLAHCDGCSDVELAGIDSFVYQVRNFLPKTK